MPIYQLERRQVVSLDIADCWRFFSDPRNLEKITPPSLNFKTKSALPPEIYPGFMIEYTVRPLLGVPLRWLTEIVHVEAPHRFVDEQRVGPYRLWHHEHFFRVLPNDETEVHDLVTYVPPFGWLGAIFFESPRHSPATRAHFRFSPRPSAEPRKRWRSLTLPPKPLYLTFHRRPKKGAPLELKDIKAIIDLMKKNDLSVFEMEKDGFKLKLQKGAGEQTVLVAPPAFPVAATPVAAVVPAPSAAPAKESAPAATKEITSPMVGTFYRAAAPESPSFIEVGQEVNPETVVCIIEAMKVMNEIKAEVSGVIAEVVAENGKPVQFGQALFKVR